MRSGVGYAFRAKCPIDQVGPPTGMACNTAVIGGGCPSGYYQCGTSNVASGKPICCMEQGGETHGSIDDLAETYEPVRSRPARPARPANMIRARMIERRPGRRMVQARVGLPARAVRAKPVTRACKAKVTHKGLWVCCQGVCRLAVRTNR